MFDLNRPQGYAKDDYLLMWGSANYTIFELIRLNKGSHNVTDVIHAVMMAISLIAHDHTRRKQELLFNEAMRYIKANIADADEQTEEMFRVCAITMGNLTAYVDQFRGLAHTLKVGELYNFDKSYARITHAFGKPESEQDIVQL